MIDIPALIPFGQGQKDAVALIHAFFPNARLLGSDGVSFCPLYTKVRREHTCTQ